jgi:hypothetical protein
LIGFAAAFASVAAACPTLALKPAKEVNGGLNFVEEMTADKGTKAAYVVDEID